MIQQSSDAKDLSLVKLKVSVFIVERIAAKKKRFTHFIESVKAQKLLNAAVI